MELQPYVDSVREQLIVAAESSGDDGQAIADRMTAGMDAAIRLALLEAISEAANEITLELAPGSVDVRLRGRDPEFVLDLPVDHEPEPQADAAVIPTESEDTAARITLRLSESLKSRIEQSAGRDGVSVNSWLIRTLNSATSSPTQHTHTSQRGFTGWVR